MSKGSSLAKVAGRPSRALRGRPLTKILIVRAAHVNFKRGVLREIAIFPGLAAMTAGGKKCPVVHLIPEHGASTQLALANGSAKLIPTGLFPRDPVHSRIRTDRLRTGGAGLRHCGWEPWRPEVIGEATVVVRVSAVDVHAVGGILASPADDRPIVDAPARRFKAAVAAADGGQAGVHREITFIGAA